MRVWRTLMMMVPVAVGLTVAPPIPGRVLAQTVDCGAILGPGGIYTLDRDLTCAEVLPSDPDWHPSDRVGIIKLIGGATLNLNGHTLTCSTTLLANGVPSSAPMFGVVVRSSTLLNGTVRGCGSGVVTSGSLVRNVVFDGNGVGISLDYRASDGHSVFIGNTLKNNGTGVYGQDTVGDVLIDNTAENNRIAFWAADFGGTFIGNSAVGNDVGFLIKFTHALIGTRAIRNRIGFRIEGARQITGNIAKNNAEDGFSLDTTVLQFSEFDQTRYNVAYRNGHDGFRIALYNRDGNPTLEHNYALHNRGVGLHVLTETGDPASPPKTITRNIAIRNHGGDLADDAACRWTHWLDNTFETAAQSCID